jgi:hypothetical protein
MWLTGSAASLSIISQSPGQSHAIWNGGGDGKIETISDDWGVNGSTDEFVRATRGQFDHRTRLAEDVETLRTAWRIKSI